MIEEKLLKVKVILGSTRRQRRGGRPTKWLLEYLKTRKELDVELLDLKTWDLPYFDEEKSPEELEGEYCCEKEKDWVKKIDEADSYIIVSPEYNHGYSGALKNALDYAFEEWKNKPVAFVPYSQGGFAGARMLEQLKLVCLELGLIPLNDALYIARVGDTFSEEGELLDEKYNEKLESFIENFVNWSKLLKEAREGKSI